MICVCLTIWVCVCVCEYLWNKKILCANCEENINRIVNWLINNYQVNEEITRTYEKVKEKDRKWRERKKCGIHKLFLILNIYWITVHVQKEYIVFFLILNAK